MWLGGQLTQGKTLTQLMAHDPSATQEQNASHRETIQRVMRGMAQSAPKIGINPNTLELPSPKGKSGVVKYNAEPDETNYGRTPQQKRRASLMGRGLLGFGGAAGLVSTEARRQ
jgi:hypothetical protein